MKHGKHPVFVSIIQPCVAACMHARVVCMAPLFSSLFLDGGFRTGLSRAHAVPRQSSTARAVS